MNKLQNKVERLLKLGQAYRDSDRLLLISIWEDEGLALTPSQREVFLNRCTTAESITRARRKLKASYPASDKVNEERYRKFQQYRDDYGNPTIFNF